MAIVKIINGTYGYRPEGSNYVIPVAAGDPPISVDDEEAKRLIGLGVAASVESEAVPMCDSGSCAIDLGEGDNGDSNPGDIVGTLDPEDLKNWKMDDLKKLAADMGIDTTGIKKKDALIQAIASVEVTVPGDAPALDIEDVVE